MPRLSDDCDASAAGSGVQYYQRRRVAFSLEQTIAGPAGPLVVRAPFVQLAALLTGDNRRADPAWAHVSLHAVGSIRRNPGPGAMALPNESALITAAMQPPIAHVTAAPAPPPAISPLVVGRGIAEPKYRVTFRDGTEGAALYLDGNQTVSLPSSEVKVELLTTASGTLLDPPDGTTVGTGLWSDSIAAASVSWTSRTSGSTAPDGMATYTQTASVQIDPELGPLPILFERPPYARQVAPIWGRGMTGATIFATADYMSGVNTPLGRIWLGLALGLPQPELRQTLPASCTHVRVLPTAAAPAGGLVSMVWLIGVR